MAMCARFENKTCDVLEDRIIVYIKSKGFDCKCSNLEHLGSLYDFGYYNIQNQFNYRTKNP